MNVWAPATKKGVERQRQRPERDQRADDDELSETSTEWVMMDEEEGGRIIV